MFRLIYDGQGIASPAIFGYEYIGSLIRAGEREHLPLLLSLDVMLCRFDIYFQAANFSR